MIAIGVSRGAQRLNVLGPSYDPQNNRTVIFQSPVVLSSIGRPPTTESGSSHNGRHSVARHPYAHHLRNSNVYMTALMPPRSKGRTTCITVQDYCFSAPFPTCWGTACDYHTNHLRHRRSWRVISIRIPNTLPQRRQSLPVWILSRCPGPGRTALAILICSPPRPSDP
jgi:hypothetical protein